MYFLCYLNDNLGGIGDIQTENKLHRLFKKWLVVRNNPQAHEFWSIISSALLVLEKEGKVERHPRQRQRNNSQKTIWYLPQNAENFADEAKYWLNQKKIGTYCPEHFNSKLESSSMESESETGGKEQAVADELKKAKQAKIIPPSSAQKLVFDILGYLGGPVPMCKLVDLCKNHVLLYREISPDQFPGDDEGSREKWDPADRGEALRFMISEESSSRSDQIWQKLAGRRHGHKVLCLYIIPKYLSDQDVILEDFGNPTTVDSTKRDIFKVLKEYLDFHQLPGEERSHIDRIIDKTLQKINRMCSENGFGANLKK